MIPYESDPIFIEMMSLSMVYLKEKKKTRTIFSGPCDFFINNPTGNPFFKATDDSTKWLLGVMQYGIYDIEQVLHRKDPSRSEVENPSCKRWVTSAVIWLSVL